MGIKAEQKLNRRPRLFRLARAKWTWVTHTHSNRVLVDGMRMRGDSVEIDDQDMG